MTIYRCSVEVSNLLSGITSVERFCCISTELDSIANRSAVESRNYIAEFHFDSTADRLAVDCLSVELYNKMEKCGWEVNVSTYE